MFHSFLEDCVIKLWNIGFNINEESWNGCGVVYKEVLALAYVIGTVCVCVCVCV
jgi:hypothetical protein